MYSDIYFENDYNNNGGSCVHRYIYLYMQLTTDFKKIEIKIGIIIKSVTLRI